MGERREISLKLAELFTTFKFSGRLTSGLSSCWYRFFVVLQKIAGCLFKQTEKISDNIYIRIDAFLFYFKNTISLRFALR